MIAIAGRWAACGVVLVLVMGAAGPAQQMQQTQEAREAPDVTDEAPDFELEDHEGKTYRLSDFRGDKNVVLEFIRSGGW